MPLALLILFIALPIAELYVIIEVGQAIGIAPTLAILLLDGLLGAALARSQGRNAWRRFNEVLAAGRVPARETFDGAMIIVGGAFLLAPGFITDIVGFALLVPPTRSALRGLIARLAKRRVAFGWTVASFPPGGSRPGGGPSGRPPGGSRTRPADYDYEGTAREVPETDAELPRGREE